MRLLISIYFMLCSASGAWAWTDVRLDSVSSIRHAVYYSLPEQLNPDLSKVGIKLSNLEGGAKAFEERMGIIDNPELPQIFFTNSFAESSVWRKPRCTSFELFSFTEFKQVFLNNYDPKDAYKEGYGSRIRWKHRVAVLFDLKRGFLGGVFFKNIKSGSKIYVAVAGRAFNFDNLIDPNTMMIHDEIKTNRTVFPNQGELALYYESEKFETSLLRECEGFNIYQMEIVK